MRSPESSYSESVPHTESIPQIQPVLASETHILEVKPPDLALPILRSANEPQDVTDDIYSTEEVSHTLILAKEVSSVRSNLKNDDGLSALATNMLINN